MTSAPVSNTAHARSIVSRWFGPHFADLHPQLQALHLHGGTLRGTVAITIGTGFLAAWLGRRLARSIGIPIDQPQRGFAVDIRHSDHALLWNRRFDNRVELRSTFVPVGTWPDGYWVENTGALQLRLTVDVDHSGGWRWRPLRVRLHGLPLPLHLLPQSHAGKWVDADGRYVFEVAFVMPFIGTLLRYGGELQLEAADAAQAG